MLTQIKENLATLDLPLAVWSKESTRTLMPLNQLVGDQISINEVAGTIPAVTPNSLGSEAFRKTYGLKYAYMGGAMANGIHSARMVAAFANAGMLGSFGAGGLTLDRIAQSISDIKQAVGDKTFAMNMLHNPADPEWEMQVVQLCLDNGVKVVEAAAYINLTPALVYFRLKGVQLINGQVVPAQRVIAKISRPEVASKFLAPAPDKIVAKLVASGHLTETEAKLGEQLAMADDITVEADSGGHTDHGSLTCIFPQMLRLATRLHKQYGYQHVVRVGAAGGIGCPEAVAAAYAMGAAYVVTGSINQACIESGTSDQVREMLTGATTADVVSSPSADMFELGAQVQTLKKGTMYGVRSQKLYQIYKRYDSLEQIPEAEQQQLEKQMFHKPLTQIWDDTKAFFASRNLQRIADSAEQDPKRKMALVFQWYLGQSSKWAITGDAQRRIDYQIWCGPAMGSNNDWLQDTHLHSAPSRTVESVANYLLNCAAYLTRVNIAKTLSVSGIEQCQDGTFPIRLQQFSEFTDAQSQKEEIKKDSIQGEQKKMNTVVNQKLDLTESKEYFKKLWEVLPGGAHYNFADPERALIVPFVKGKGSRVWDMDGNEHLDLFCKFGALFVGHNNEQYNQILIENMQKLTSVDTFDLEYEVCQKLIDNVPSAERVRFSLSGTEAVQNAIRLARGYTGKPRFIRFHGHYNGNADNVIGGRYNPETADFPVPEMFKGDMLDTLGRFPNTLQDQTFMLPWNEPEILEQTLEKYGHEIAAVLMEPICMNGGGILPKDGYLERAKAACEKHNVVLIFDEVITGVRFGLGGAQKLLGVTPHITTLGKALGGGAVPISAIVGRKDIMDYYTKGKIIHAGTFNGYPMGLAAIKATFDLIENEPGCYDRMGGLMSQMADIFVKAAHAADMPLVLQGMPTGMVFHSQNELVDRSEGYTAKVKMCDIIIREISKRYGIQFSPLSRMYSNLMLNQDDVSFFEERIYPAMVNAKQIIDITFPKGL
ncbi:PfaD family polyunsaturated fatty acid/polyketide biosynthesis protein [Pseudoalteromonas sp. S16_S37]|uniref:PfaD family polyunsaturated fatty acid/polyketide biosynthesis protein n=1 Tax=Pseudoalteromonas sp. S16_S37 TaxID=2720228 RepID=UPI0016809150|nr:PfaD family polyunsaturated fatty acid/polyketide biosynthesis protein [Pseudoalteromonas sp. S16_S37]MBD1580789.1 PfaD family polyunsaturated fatty acid/polyketide biosynthesis protein [Pseudoalteromonas sp. S16_S37]